MKAREILEETFFLLIRLGIGNSVHSQIHNEINWIELEKLAAKQGLSAVIMDGIEKLPEEKRPPKKFLLQWIGETLQGYEYRYELYRKTIAEIAGFFNGYGLKMMVLKGYACSIDWPKPEHRPCGDIDIWLFGKQKEADTLLKENGITVDTGEHHHTVFYWKDFMVENHYDFINVYRNQPNHRQEKLLKELGADDSHFLYINDERVCVPSANLHAFFLIRHNMGHFVTSEITIRQVLDWAFFVKKHREEVDWPWLLKILNEYHMLDFFNCINAICVEDLGFESSIFPYVQFEPSVKERVVDEIMIPEFSEKEPKYLFPRVFFKYRRWKASEWKHKLCYEESMWTSFWNGVWNHVLKPSSI